MMEVRCQAFTETVTVSCNQTEDVLNSTKFQSLERDRAVDFPSAALDKQNTAILY